MMTGFEGLVMLLRPFRVDVEQYQINPRPLKWFQWGYVNNRGQPHAWYILIALPSYLMKSTDYDMGPPVMHQRHLIFREKLPAGEGGWHEIEIPCDI